MKKLGTEIFKKKGLEICINQAQKYLERRQWNMYKLGIEICRKQAQKYVEIRHRNMQKLGVEICRNQAQKCVEICIEMYRNCAQ